MRKTIISVLVLLVALAATAFAQTHSGGGGTGGGTSVSVNGSSVTTPNFNGTTPVADSGYTLGTWKVSGSNVSLELPTGGAPSGSAGGSLNGTYPNPGVAGRASDAPTFGRLGLVALATPPAPAAVATCSGMCATSYTYEVTAYLIDGTNAPTSAASTPVSNAATIDGTHFNTITLPGSTYASGCFLWRITPNGTKGLVNGTVAACNAVIVDNTASLDGSSPPATVSPLLSFSTAGGAGIGGADATNSLYALGGWTASYAGIKNVGGVLHARLADDSADAPLQATNLSLAAGGIVSSADTGSPAITFGSSIISMNQDLSINVGTTAGEALYLVVAEPGSAGTRPSPYFDMRGTSYDTTPHSAFWREYVNPTANDGTSSLLFRSHIDIASYATRLSLGDDGLLTLTGNLSLPAGASISSANTGTPTIGFGTNSITVSQPLTATGSGTITATTMPWSGNTNPAAGLSLTMGANTSTFNTTSALNQLFAWKNTTPAIVSLSQGSPVISTCGRAWTTADAEDCLTLSELPGNGANAPIAFNIGHTGTSSGVVSLYVNGVNMLKNPFSVQGQVLISDASSQPAATSADANANHVFHAGGTPGFAAIATSDLPTIPVTGGGTNATSAAAALVNLFPAGTRKGDILLCTTYAAGACSAWTLLAGNDSGTAWFQEDSGGVGSWSVPPGTGTVTASGTPAQYDDSYWTTATNLTKITAPATKGKFVKGYNLPTDAAVAPTIMQVGVGPGRTITGTSDPSGVVSGDVNTDLYFTGAASATESLPTGTTLENPSFAVGIVNATTGTNTTVTVTPTTWPIYPNGQVSLTEATLVVAQGQSCFLSVDSSGSAWDANCHEPPTSVGAGLSIARAAAGITLDLYSTTQYGINYGTGSVGAPSVITPPATAGLYFNVYNPTSSAAVAPTAVLSTSLPAGTVIGSLDTGTPAFTFGTNKITTNQALSIGSTNTGEPLYVYGASGAPNSNCSLGVRLARFQGTATNSIDIGAASASPYSIWFETCGYPLSLNPTGSGKVGIGTLAPSSKLTVNGAVSNGVTTATASDNRGTIALSSGTGSYTFTGGPGTAGIWTTAPICVASSTAVAPLQAQVVTTTSTLTLTVPGGTNADTYNYICWPGK